MQKKCCRNSVCSLLQSIFLCLLLYLFSLKVSAYTIHVEIKGVSSSTIEKILPYLSIQQSKAEQSLTEENIHTLYEKSIVEMQGILEALGYYQAQIYPHLILDPDNEGYIARYDISLGQPVKICAVEIYLEGEGRSHRSFTPLLDTCPLKIGNILDHSVYDSFKQRLLAEALQQGYLDAVYTKSYVKVDMRTLSAEIYLVLATGSRYTFGETYFINPPYPSTFLNKYIPFTQGEPYTTTQLIQLQRVLTETNLFSKVRIDPILSDTKNFLVPVEVRLSPKPHNRYTASLGYGTDTGLRSMAGWERKRLHHPGHKISLSGKVSEKRNQANLEYSLPGKKPASDTIRLTARVIEEKFNKKNSRRSKFGATYNMILFPNIEQILAFHYLSEVDRILPTAPKTRGHFLMPSVGYVWSDMKKSSYLLPYGTRLGITVRGGLGSLLSSTNMIQTDCRIKCIYPFGSLTRLILRSDFGVISAGDRNDIPLSLRYFTGGDQTIRGYGYRSLGPSKKDTHGEVIVVGGKYLFVFSTEIDRIIYKQLSLAAFLDTGNAMNKLSARLATGVGMGLRWATPLGPLRFDLAQGLNNKKLKPRIHISYGMDF